MVGFGLLQSRRRPRRRSATAHLPRRAILPTIAAILMVEAILGSGANGLAAPSVVPQARADMGMAMGPFGRVVMFGGLASETNTYFADTWIWVGEWQDVSPPDSPKPRAGVRMAFDALRNQMVLYGGTNGLTALGDTWIWDGSVWTEQHPATNPPPAANYGMAYDPVRRKIVMFLGEGLDNESVWEWDGADWTPIPVFAQRPCGASSRDRYGRHPPQGDDVRR